MLGGGARTRILGTGLIHSRLALFIGGGLRFRVVDQPNRRHSDQSH